MTKNEAIDIVHNTILGFFDLAADDSEEPISEKDKLLLEINKAVCNAIKEMPDDGRKVGAGRWIRHINNRLGKCGRVTYECSVCNVGLGCEYFVRRSYCPNCGAKMEGAEE